MIFNYCKNKKVCKICDFCLKYDTFFSLSVLTHPRQVVDIQMATCMLHPIDHFLLAINYFKSSLSMYHVGSSTAK